MEKAETKKNPAFSEYLYELNEVTQFIEVLQPSLKEIDTIDITQLNKIGLHTYTKDK